MAVSLRPLGFTFGHRNGSVGKDYDGKPPSAVVSHDLTRHRKGNLLWDAGPSDEIAKPLEGVEAGGGNFRLSVRTPLQALPAMIGSMPADVSYAAFSHLHFDHTGNANAFAPSTWLMNTSELAAVDSDALPFGMDAGLVSARKTVKLETFSGDHDVFGDGTVRVLTAPRHTHQKRKERNVPVFNTRRAISPRCTVPGLLKQAQLTDRTARTHRRVRLWRSVRDRRDGGALIDRLAGGFGGAGRI